MIKSRQTSKYFIKESIRRSFIPVCELLLGFVFITGCSTESSINILKDRNESADFKKSEIITNGPVAADGQSELLVVVQLMNSDGSPVRLFKPTYAITQGTGVQTQECTTSNSNGVSTCVLKSTHSGTKRLSITNIKMSLEKDVIFIAPSSKNSFGLAVAATRPQTSATNFKLSGAFGGNQPKGVNKTASGFKLYGGPEGNVFSRVSQ